jgi:SAM-dependent methyltransferase
LRLGTARRAPAGRPEVVCPIDGSPVHWDEAGVTCLGCGRSWKRWGRVPLFAGRAPSRPEVSDVSDDAPAARNDWRFYLPIDESTRVLELGRGDDGAAIALAYEAASVVAIREDAAEAIALERHARALALPTLAPVAAPFATLPLPNRSADVAVIHDTLARVTTGPGDPDVAQRRLLRALFRALRAGGLLWGEMPNRFAPGRRMERGNAVRGLHGLDGLGRLLAGNGFARFDAFVVLHADGQRHLVPLDDSTVFEYVRGTRARHGRGAAVRDVAARHAFRAGLVPRLASAFAFRATRGNAR